MRQEIAVRVNYDTDKCYVRKVVFNEDGRVEKKYYLNNVGDWVEVLSSLEIPIECEIALDYRNSFPNKPKVEKEIKAETPLFSLTLASGERIAVYGQSSS